MILILAAMAAAALLIPDDLFEDEHEDEALGEGELDPHKHLRSSGGAHTGDPRLQGGVVGPDTARGADWPAHIAVSPLEALDAEFEDEFGDHFEALDADLTERGEILIRGDDAADAGRPGRRAPQMPVFVRRGEDKPANGALAAMRDWVLRRGRAALHWLGRHRRLLISRIGSLLLVRTRDRDARDALHLLMRLNAST